MLQLKDIVKDYGEGDNIVHALKGISLSFRSSELVAVLGPSGCGKTTMLNIIGGLDRYTSGDVVISGKSTTTFKNSDWDAYRNNYIGFIFQNYNLISHQTILENVELALTLSGVKPKERKERAKEALIKVGLEKHINKKPNQLSGGQMQRVAIARALVNKPDIILADEPTGALDSKNSVQIMDLLKEIAKERLVIMVTHNDQLAYDYSSRIIKMLDGEVLEDTNPYVPTKEELKEMKSFFEEDPVPSVEGLDQKQAKKVLKKHSREQQKKKRAAVKKTSMSVFTALWLSLKNLFTKKNRTFLTAFAGSIGIIGIALVLSINNGFGLYIDNMQETLLGQYPISVQQMHMNMEAMMTPMGQLGNSELEKYPDSDKITIPNDNVSIDLIDKYAHYNKIDESFVEHVQSMDKNLVSEVTYSYAMKMNLMTKDKRGNYQKVVFESTDPLMELVFGDSNRFEEMVDDEFMKATYDVVAGKYPTNANEIALVVNEYNQISSSLISQFNFEVDKNNMTYNTFLNKEFKIIRNDDWYANENGRYVEKLTKPEQYQGDYATMYNNGETLKITAIMRIKKEAPLNLYFPSVLYRKELTEKVVDDNLESKMVKAQIREHKNALNNNRDEISVITGETLQNTLLDLSGIPIIGDVPSILNPLYLDAEERHTVYMQKLGASEVPKDIYIYPKTFDGKGEIREYLDSYNVKLEDKIKNDTSIPEKDKAKALKELKIYYNDPASILTDTMGQIIDIISIVLVCFASVSLVVSSIMIGIITYVSVVERTKEIGVLRSIGARRIDIGNVFNAETAIIGLTSGVMGVLIAALLTIPINLLIKHFAKGVILGNIAILSPIAAIVLIVISMSLTILAGLIPANIAAHKDPVKALRTE